MENRHASTVLEKTLLNGYLRRFSCKEAAYSVRLPPGKRIGARPKLRC
jgi:hypothetical protein